MPKTFSLLSRGGVLRVSSSHQLPFNRKSLKVLPTMLWLFGFSSSLWGGFWQLPKSPYFAFPKKRIRIRNSQNSLPSNTDDRLHLFFTAKDLYLNSNRWSLHLQIGASLCVILSRSINVTQLFQKVSCRLQYVVTVLYRSIDIIYLFIYIYICTFFFCEKHRLAFSSEKNPTGKSQTYLTTAVGLELTH